MGTRGGPGRGQGRKKGSVGTHTLEVAKMRENLVKRIAEKWNPLIDAQFDLALGHKRIIKHEGKDIGVYDVSPDGTAIQYLTNQSIGKPKETIDVSGTIVNPNNEDVIKANTILLKFIEKE